MDRLSSEATQGRKSERKKLKKVEKKNIAKSTSSPQMELLMELK
jgi:hypothetical protein